MFKWLSTPHVDSLARTTPSTRCVEGFIIDKGKESVEELGSFEFFECVVGILVENPPPLPSWTYKAEERKKKQGERNGVGGRGAEYESEAEERVRWLFIEMRKLALIKLQYISSRPTALHYTDMLVVNTFQQMKVSQVLATYLSCSFQVSLC